MCVCVRLSVVERGVHEEGVNDPDAQSHRYREQMCVRACLRVWWSVVFTKKG